MKRVSVLLGEYIRCRRRNLGITQLELSRSVGLSRGTVIILEKRGMNLSLDKVQIIFQKLRTNFGEFENFISPVSLKDIK